MKITPIITALLLLGSNILLWNVEKLYLHTPPRRPLPPHPSADISRTADDIARGILFQHSRLSPDQRSKLRPLTQQGYELRKELTEENYRYTILQEDLLQQALTILEKK